MMQLITKTRETTTEELYYLKYLNAKEGQMHLKCTE